MTVELHKIAMTQPEMSRGIINDTAIVVAVLIGRLALRDDNKKLLFEIDGVVELLLNMMATGDERSQQIASFSYQR